MDHETRTLTIGRLAAAADVNVETIRFYQRKGLLRVPLRPVGGIRRYAAEDVARVKFIKSAQRLGFRLDEIHHLLRLDEGMQCQAAAELAAHHLTEVRTRLQDLGRIEATLADLLARCHQDDGTVACPVIVALHAHDMDTC